MSRQIVKFGLVGALATLTHMLVGGALIQVGLTAIVANPVAFIAAFFLSFSGHYAFSFADRGIPLWKSLRRFVLVACAGFLTNQALLSAILNFLFLPEIHALLISTGIVAVVTFGLSKTWAFRNPGLVS